MPREEKVAQVEELEKVLRECCVGILTDYRGITAAESTEPVVNEVEVGDRAPRTLLIHAAAFPQEGPPMGTVAVFHDVTELRRLESVRRDFVANASHELQTPLTAIRGFAETLVGNDLSQIAWTFTLARRAYRTIGWNLAWAFVYNVVGIGLAMAGILHPVLAAAAMVSTPTSETRKAW